MDLPVMTPAQRRLAELGDQESVPQSALFNRSPEETDDLAVSSAGRVAAISKGPSLRRPGRGLATVLTAAACIGLLLYGSGLRMRPINGGTATSVLGRDSSAVGNAVISLPPPNLLRPISPEEAVKENSERPFVNRPDTPAARFVLRTEADDHSRAVTCLAQAVYYEAAGEGVDGGRAVAQVVLNRLHHPGYPASICGVVYQGAERPSGCQFTFTCDGSLLRTPIASLWARSQKIAEEALAGKVYAPIGHATHYHADYVLPYWADSLDKTVQIGRHIFYRLRGSIGDNRAFFQRYAGAEPMIPSPSETVDLSQTPEAERLANALISDDVKGSMPVAEKAAISSSPLLIDSTRGTLVADAGGSTSPAEKRRITSDCAAESERKQLAPLGANDMRSGLRPSGC
jgi:spore germination cell wall hydrolase CwlJ-like protein